MVCPVERPSSPATRVRGGPRAKSSRLPAPLRLPAGSSPLSGWHLSGAPHLLNPASGKNARDAPGLGECAEGQSIQRVPLSDTVSEAAKPRVSAAQTQAALTRVGNSVSPHPRPPSSLNAHPPRASQGELPAEAQGRRPQKRAGLRRPGRAALGPPLPLAPSRLLSLPRRLQHPAADTRGRRKPEQGGTGQGRLGYDSGSPAPDLAGEPGRVHGRPQSTAPSSPALSAALSPDPRDCAELLRAVGERLLLGCWRQMVAAAAPRFADEGAMRRGRLRGSLVPGAARQEPSLSPTFRAGRTPAARPRRKISMKAGPGKSSGWLQDKVGGSSSTAKKTLPYRPGLFGKLPRRKWGAARVLPFPAGLAGGRSKYICLALPGTFVTLGGLVSMRKGGVFRELQNSWILPFKDECASAFYLLEMLF